MNRPGWVVHKRAFVTLGHKSLPSACLGVGHKGIAQCRPAWRESDARDLRLRPHQPPQGLRTVGQRPGNPVSSKMDLSHPAVVTSSAGILWRYVKHISESGRGERDLRNEKGGPFHPGDYPTTGSVEIPGATTPEDFGCGGAAGEGLQGCLGLDGRRSRREGGRSASAHHDEFSPGTKAHSPGLTPALAAPDGSSFRPRKQ